MAAGRAGTVLEQYFTDFGPNAGAAVRGMLTRPGKVAEVVSRSDRLAYYRMMLAPVAFLAVAEPPTLLLVAGPLAAINVLTSDIHARNYRFHYSGIVLAGIILATVEAVAMLGRSPSARRFFVGVLAATALATTVAWGPSPVGVDYRSGIWGLPTDPRNDLKREALRLVPPDAAVSAGYDTVPHLSHRTQIYEFPQPWIAFVWGVRGEDLPDPNRVEWLVLDKQRLLFDEWRRLADRLLSQEFSARYERDGVVVAQRTRPE